MIYIKQSGKEVDVSDRSIEYAKSLGWTEKGAEAPKKIAKKKTPKSKD